MQTSVQTFLRRAALDGERTLNLVRGSVLTLVLFRLLLVNTTALLDAKPKYLLAATLMATGLMIVAWIHRQLSKDDTDSGILVFSTVFDSVLTFSVLLLAVLEPHETYIGLLRSPDSLVWILVIATAGLRLSTTATRVGTLAGLAGFGGLTLLEVGLAPQHLVYAPGELVLAAVLAVGAAMLGLTVESRIRKLVLQAAEEAHRAERVMSRFGAYVFSDEVASMLMADGDAVNRGRQCDVAVLFSDLRGFTTYAETIDADALVAELNAYFDVMVPVIQSHGGVVDKYIGDAIMAVFGLPTATGDESGSAIRAAGAMQAAMAAHNEDRAARALPPLRQGVGVHFGPVIAGSVGTSDRLQYTVIGDTVNVASRLESATKDAGVSYLISAMAVDHATRGATDIPALVELEPLSLRGKAEPLRVYGPG